MVTQIDGNAITKSLGEKFEIYRATQNKVTSVHIRINFYMMLPPYLCSSHALLEKLYKDLSNTVRCNFILGHSVFIGRQPKYKL